MDPTQPNPAHYDLTDDDQRSDYQLALDAWILFCCDKAELDSYAEDDELAGHRIPGWQGMPKGQLAWALASNSY